MLADEDAAFQTGTGLNTVNFGNLPGSVDIDAVHGLANGDVLFSLDTSTTLGGTLYRPYDVIRFDESQVFMLDVFVRINDRSVHLRVKCDAPLVFTIFRKLFDCFQ